MRKVRIAGIILLCLLAVAVLGLYFVTHQYNAAPQVVARVEQMFGGRAELTRANVGLGHSTAEGLKLYEEGDPHHPWLTADRLRVDASIMQLLEGAMPSRLSLQGVAVYLRFD